jgi:pyridoxamine 5'-phosphate oxidase
MSDSLLPDDVVATFDALLERARASGDREPTAMTLATVDATGQPSARTVLLKSFDARGFVFYTHLDSRKGRQLAGDARAALLFHWKLLDEGIQVHVEGTVEPVEAAEADAYFATRPRESQLGAWASLQSQPLPDRDTFEMRLAEAKARFAGGDVPRPPGWSGFRVRPAEVEFWYGARFRLHERQRWTRVDGAWQRRMLYP